MFIEGKVSRVWITFTLSFLWSHLQLQSVNGNKYFYDRPDFFGDLFK